MIRVALYEGDADLLPSLHHQERDLLSPRAVPKRRDDFARGRFVARALLADVLSLEPRAIAVMPDDRGIPWAEHDDLGRLPVSVSISHTKSMAAAAVVDLPLRVGVDVEGPIDSAWDIATEYFEPCELQLCEAVQKRELPRWAAQIWSLKEAGLKVLGTGLTVPASAVVVQAIGQKANVTGWYPVQMFVGRGAPAEPVEMCAWTRQVSGVSVSLAVGRKVQKGTVLRGTVQKGTVQKGTVQKGTVQKGTVQKGTVLRSCEVGDRAANKSLRDPNEDHGNGVHAKLGGRSARELRFEAVPPPKIVATY